MTDQKKSPGRPGRTVNPDEYSIIAKNIDKRMADVGIKTKVELSKRSDVSRTVITNIFIMPNKGVMGDSAVRLAKALQCRVEWLITGEGPITDDELTGVPIFQILNLKGVSIDDKLENDRNLNTTRKVPCPAGFKLSYFGIVIDVGASFDSSKKYSKFEKGGILFFDRDAKPNSGDLTLVKTSQDATPEIMEYYSVHGKEVVSALNDNLPEALRTIEMTEEMQVLGTHISYAYNQFRN